MDVSGSYRIAASRERVWQALNDPDILRACIPGCQELRRDSDGAYDARVTTRIGSIKATFNGRMTLSDLDPPNGYTISGQGNGGAAGFAKGSARVRLAGDGAGTLLTYSAKADIGGKIASLGNRLMQGVAVKTADDFFGRFSTLLAPAERPPIDAAITEPVEPVGGAVPITSRPLPPPAPETAPSHPPERSPRYHTGAVGIGAFLFVLILLLLYFPAR